MIPKEDRKGITLDTQDQLILRKAEEMVIILKFGYVLY